MTDSLNRECDDAVVDRKKPPQGALINTQDDRASLYNQYFVSQVARNVKPSEFIQQVNGYGVQVFAQASSFKLP